MINILAWLIAAVLAANLLYFFHFLSLAFDFFEQEGFIPIEYLVMSFLNAVMFILVLLLVYFGEMIFC